jgi:hypothetical protein
MFEKKIDFKINRCGLNKTKDFVNIVTTNEILLIVMLCALHVKCIKNKFIVIISIQNIFNAYLQFN